MSQGRARLPTRLWLLAPPALGSGPSLACVWL